MNYRPPPPLPTEKRLARLTSWLTLTLCWFAAHVLAHFAPRSASRRLAHYGRVASALIVLHALKRHNLRRSAGRKIPGIQLRHATIRRICGAKMRRALRARTPIEHARAIYAAITDPERWMWPYAA